jgi:hypothetical protein
LQIIQLPHVWVESKGVQQAIPGHREQTAQKMIERINQSFIKDYREYMAERECGNIIHAKYVQDLLLENDKPGQMEVGSYVEFNITGALPKNGRQPMPIYNQDQRPNADYRKALGAAHLVTEYMQRMGLRMVHWGKRYDYGRFTGTIDLIVECTRRIEFENGIVWEVGDLLCIDMKYSGLMGETGPRKNKHGWQWSQAQKEYHGTQAIQYHMLTKLPFYFWVTQSNQNEGETPDVELFHIPVTKAMIDAQISEGNKLYDNFKIVAKVGFNPLPSLKRCNKCPLKLECDDKHTFPHPRIIHLYEN